MRKSKLPKVSLFSWPLKGKIIVGECLEKRVSWKFSTTHQCSSHTPLQALVYVWVTLVWFPFDFPPCIEIFTHYYTFVLRQRTHTVDELPFNKDAFLVLSRRPYLLGWSELDRLGFGNKVDWSKVYQVPNRQARVLSTESRNNWDRFVY